MLLPKLIQLRYRLPVFSQRNLVYCVPLVSSLLCGLNTRFSSMFNYDFSVPEAKDAIHPTYKLKWVPPRVNWPINGHKFLLIKFSRFALKRHNWGRPTDSSTWRSMAWCAGMLSGNLATCPNMALRPLIIRSDTGARPVRKEISELRTESCHLGVTAVVIARDREWSLTRGPAALPQCRCRLQQQAYLPHHVLHRDGQDTGTDGDYRYGYP